jgi:hypothetical protein
MTFVMQPDHIPRPARSRVDQRPSTLRFARLAPYDHRANSAKNTRYAACPIWDTAAARTAVRTASAFRLRALMPTLCQAHLRCEHA